MYREINLDEQPEFVEHVKNLGFNAAQLFKPGWNVSGFQPARIEETFNKHSICLNRVTATNTRLYFRKDFSSSFFLN